MMNWDSYPPKLACLSRHCSCQFSDGSRNRVGSLPTRPQDHSTAAYKRLIEVYSSACESEILEFPSLYLKCRMVLMAVLPPRSCTSDGFFKILDGMT